MTRTIFSVPEGRSSTRPFEPSSASARATASAIGWLPRRPSRSTPETFTSTCGKTCMTLASSAMVRPERTISAASWRPVSTPSPVVACWLKMMWPDCSPPSASPYSPSASST